MGPGDGDDKPTPAGTDRSAELRRTLLGAPPLPVPLDGDSTATLREHPLFHGLAEPALLALAAASGRVELAAGDVLVTEGEAADAAFLVLAGRLAVSVQGRQVGELRRGDLVGEMALLVDEPRSATVTARRLSVVVRIDGAAFTSLLAAQPNLHRRIGTELVTRLRRANAGVAVSGRGQVIAVLGDGSPVTAELGAALQRALEATGCSTARHRIGAGATAAEVGASELHHDLVLVDGSDDPRHAGSACRHADRIVLFADARHPPRTARQLLAADNTTPVELVLVHPAGTDCPRGTQHWLADVRPAAHHHLRRGDDSHLARLARRLVGRPVALVFSGGGARGLAHAGAYRALVERGVPIDVVAGTSAGSIYAVAVGRGWDPDRVEEVSRQLMVDVGSPVDPTLPAIALASGKRLNRRIRAAFGDDDLRLEDLWVPATIVSTNLTTASVHEHHHGLAWRAVRASVAIPGVFPPLAEPEGLLVDGGLTDNLPVARMRAQHAGATVIASDAGRRIEFTSHGFPDDGEISGWSAWRLRRRRQAGGGRVPGLVGLLGRLTALGGAGTAMERGDVHIDHELPGVGMFDFAKGTAIMRAGHARSAAVLDAHATELAAWSAAAAG
jgi:NTE family protein